jgi:cytochrome c-type biogenesis protein CcmF
LGDTSVHAFTDLGMNWQLLIFILVFLIPALSLYFKRYKSIPTIIKEEQTFSREFWMFIGALILFLSGFVIIFITSLPVFNKIVTHIDFLKSIFKNSFAQPEDPEFTHNQIQVFVAVILGFLTAFTQFLKYKDTSKEYLRKKIMIPVIITIVISLLIIFFGGIRYDKKGIGFLVAIHMAIVGSVYTIVANASYIWLVLKGKIKVAGASVAHIGFGLILLGILISSGKKTVLSWNKTGINVLEKTKQEDPAENTTLFKGIKTDMGQYMVTYTKDSLNERDRKRYFEIDFQPKDGSKGFKVYPDVIKNNKGAEGFAANPDAKHFLFKDIFVYITSFKEDDKIDTTHFRNEVLKAGDTVYYGNGFMIFNKILLNPIEQKQRFSQDETAMFLDIQVISKEGNRYAVMPGIAVKNQSLRIIPDTVVAQNLIVQFNKVVDQKLGKLEIGVKESKSLTTLLTHKVLEFPMIKFLWLGVVVMFIGFIMSVKQRISNFKA